MAADLCEDVRRLILEKAEKQCQATMIITRTETHYVPDPNHETDQESDTETEEVQREVEGVKYVITRNKYDPPYHATFHFYERPWMYYPTDGDVKLTDYKRSNASIKTIRTYNKQMCEWIYMKKVMDNRYKMERYYTQDMDYDKNFKMANSKCVSGVVVSYNDKDDSKNVLTTDQYTLGLRLPHYDDKHEEAIWKEAEILLFNF